jgi:RecA/RadA recombinase
MPKKKTTQSKKKKGSKGGRKLGQKGTGKGPKAATTGIFHRYTVEGKFKKVQEFCKAANKALKGDGKIVTGDQLDDLEFRKEITGLPHVDFVLNGGLIRGGASQLWGKFKSGKTTTASHISSNYQRRGLAVAVASIENFDKAWWRRVGSYIPYSSKEIDALDRVQRKKAIRYNAFFEKQGTVPLSLIVHHDPVSELDLVIKAVRQNVYDLIIIDSLGQVVDSSEVEEKSLGDHKYGGESALFSKFCKFVMNGFNRRYDEENNVETTGDRANQTTLLCLNQARVELGTKARAHDKQSHPTGGEALKHLWNQEIFHRGSEDFSDAVQYNGKPRRNVYSRMFEVKGTKMRGGPEQRVADFRLSIKQHEEGGRIWRPGQIDLEGSLRALSVMLGVVEQRGPSVAFGGAKFKGKAAFEEALRKDPAMYNELYEQMLKAAYKESLMNDVPEVWDYV